MVTLLLGIANADWEFNPELKTESKVGVAGERAGADAGVVVSDDGAGELNDVCSAGVWPKGEEPKTESSCSWYLSWRLLPEPSVGVLSKNPVKSRGLFDLPDLSLSDLSVANALSSVLPDKIFDQSASSEEIELVVPESGVEGSFLSFFWSKVV